MMRSDWKACPQCGVVVRQGMAPPLPTDAELDAVPRLASSAIAEARRLLQELEDAIQVTEEGSKYEFGDGFAALFGGGRVPKLGEGMERWRIADNRIREVLDLDLCAYLDESPFGKLTMHWKKRTPKPDELIAVMRSHVAWIEAKLESLSAT